MARTLTKGKILIVADCAVDTGFARVAHSLINELYHHWDLHVLAINFNGDPHVIQKKAKLYNPQAGAPGDLYGFNRIVSLVHSIQPDLIFMINDSWILKDYIERIKAYQEDEKQLNRAQSKIIVYTPVDALNLKSDFIEPLNYCTHVVAYTEFGKRELIKGGLTVPCSVIYHGVDTSIFSPVDKDTARIQSGFDPKWFIVQSVDRNQQRKRIDLTFYYFAEWVKRTRKDEDVRLYYHGALRDEGHDLLQLADYLGIRDRIIITSANITPSNGLDVKYLKYVYSVADVGISTTVAEGLAN